MSRLARLTLCGWLQCALLGLVATPALALDLGLDVGATSQRLYAKSSGAVTEDQFLTGAVLRAGVGITDQVLLGLEWWPVEERATLFQRATTVLDVHAFTAEARYRYPVFDWLQPYARGGVGVTWTTLELTDVTTLSDWAVSPHALAGVGVELLVPKRLPGGKLLASFGVSFELGYQHTLGQDLRLEQTDAPLQARPLDLGTLTLTGLTTRLAAVLRL